MKHDRITGKWAYEFEDVRHTFISEINMTYCVTFF